MVTWSRTGGRTSSGIGVDSCGKDPAASICLSAGTVAAVAAATAAPAAFRASTVGVVAFVTPVFLAAVKGETA